MQVLLIHMSQVYVVDRCGYLEVTSHPRHGDYQTCDIWNILSAAPRGNTFRLQIRGHGHDYRVATAVRIADDQGDFKGVEVAVDALD
ncbi:MAG TPA: hypothetical protein DEA32_02995 [Firmicutes bacterium]|nr:hypothetical protein [Bacillota bacterium]